MRGWKGAATTPLPDEGGGSATRGASFIRLTDSSKGAAAPMAIHSSPSPAETSSFPLSSPLPSISTIACSVNGPKTRPDGRRMRYPTASVLGGGGAGGAPSPPGVKSISSSSSGGAGAAPTGAASAAKGSGAAPWSRGTSPKENCSGDVPATGGSWAAPPSGADSSSPVPSSSGTGKSGASGTGSGSALASSAAGSPA